MSALLQTNCLLKVRVTVQCRLQQRRLLISNGLSQGSPAVFNVVLTMRMSMVWWLWLMIRRACGGADN